MGTEIKSWQIVDGKLRPIPTSLRQEEHPEYDLEAWIESSPGVPGRDVVIIGRQTVSKSGPRDLLGVDKAGNVVIVEIKRDQLPREALAQAIDDASDVAEWTVEKLGETCSEYCKKSLEEVITQAFPDIDVENLNSNDTQRIVLVGFAVESALERMIEWLSGNFGVNINAVVLSYAKTSGGDELLTKTSIISEELEQERAKKQRKFQIPMSDDPGKYERDVLARLLRDCLAQERVTTRRVKDVLLPALLKHKTLSREQLKKELLANDSTLDESKVGYYVSTMSSQLGMKKNEFHRQVVAYEYPTYA